MSEEVFFELSEDFLNQYKRKQPKWGPLGYVTYKRTYSRPLPNGKSEEYWQTLKRVVEGVFTIQKRHCINNKLPWNSRKANNSAQRMFELMWDFKFTPPGRGLWMMGTDYVYERGSAALNNCAFVSTENIGVDFAEPFCFLMDMSMLGVGVGGDTKGVNKITIKEPKISDEVFVVEDSREGWVDLLRTLLNSYVGRNPKPKAVDYSQLRPYGAPIKSFGGVSSGHEPLEEMYNSISDLLDKTVGKKVDSATIVDIFNLVGRCVVSGGVRRCLPKGTIVHTNRGLVPIEDMKKGMLVRTQFGWKDVTDVVHQGEQEVVTVRTELGEFECTPDHRVKVFKKLDGYEWKQAQELTSDDKLVFLNGIENEDIKAHESTLPEWSYEKPKNSTTSVDIKIPELDEDIAWLVGLIQGDGYVTEQEISIAIHRDDEEIIDRAKTTLERFGVNVRLSGGTDDDKAVRIRVKSNQLGTYFYTHIKQPNTTLKVPEFIKSTNINSIIYSYIAGVFDADGARTSRPILVVTSVYENFVKELQMLLAYMGIPSKINHRKSTIENWQDKYNLYVIGEKHRKRISDILFNYSEKFIDNNITTRSQNDYGFSRDWILESRTLKYNNKVKFHKIWSPNSEQMTECTFERCTGETLNVTPISVLEVIHNRKLVDTYDISVEDEHEFAFGFGLLSHNTAEIMFGEPDDEVFLELKNPEKFKDELMHHRWASNNSIFAEIGMDYSMFADMTAKNGEPGYMWLDNARKYSRMDGVVDNKDYRVAGANPCSEQSLESYELCCVTGDTRIQTKTDIPKIKDVVGKEVEIWNGSKWSKVKPFSTGKRPIYRVELSDGSYLDVTDNHEWSVRKPTERTFKKKTTMELEAGMYLPEFELKNINTGKHEINAYSIGWFTGDGHMDKNRPMAVVQQPEYEKVLPNLNCIQYKEQHPLFYKNPFRRVSFSNIISESLGKELRDYNKGLPDEIFKYDIDSLKDFFGGWIDSDGSLRQQENTDNYVLFGSENKLRDAQLLLRRVGVNHSTLSLMSPKGFRTNKGIRSHDLYCLLIPSYESHLINTKLKTAERFGSRYKVNNAHKKSELIDAARKQKIVRVLITPKTEETFCFTEPEKHMGVFGNVLTYQCLVETYPEKHDNLEEWIETLKYAYMYAKSVTLIPTHNTKTNSVMMRNRRIGTSISGITQSFTKFGRRNFFRACDDGYGKLQKWDKTYSDWLCIPRSIKTTSIKPSGSVSLLGGSSPGIHYPISQYYIRNIRFQKGSAILEELKEAGYPIEKDKYSLNTYVVSFPIKERHFDRSVDDVSMWEQLENAAQIQEYWADNQVSITVTFSQEEAKDIKYALELYETRLKSVSFLPKLTHGYEQAPYIPITEELFNELTSNLAKKLKIKDAEHVDDKFCTTDYCEVKTELTDMDEDNDSNK